MNLLIVGGGGREHAMVEKLLDNPRITKVYALPGNGGMAQKATCIPIKATDIDEIVTFAKERAIDYAVVAPDDPLCLGLVDKLTAAGIPAFGPDAKAAIIEGSKVFSKNLMKKYGIPTAEYAIFEKADEALAYIRGAAYPLVLKADGLALGKGVLICQSEAEAEAGVRDMMEAKRFGASGSRIVVEEYLTGPEVTVLCFTDGKVMRPMVASMDHKRALDGDEGLNTGGMGVIAPNPFYTEETENWCMEHIFLPTMEAMNKEGRTFKGCLYFGLMLTEKGPKVIEYNCRFGDPETQAVLPLLKGDLLTLMQAVTEERLSEVSFKNDNRASCCVVLASGGYPGAYETGKVITGLDVACAMEDIYVYHAGTQRIGNATYTAGGRVLAVTALADTLDKAMKKAYAACDVIDFEGKHLRRDIGAKALAAQ